MKRAFYSTLKTMLASKLETQLSKSLRQPPKNEDLVFGKTFTDHMLSVGWDNKQGWDCPSIKPYSKLELYPSSVVFHYAFACFEGMKAYKNENGEIRLFRPEMNLKRLNSSCHRLSLPTFNEKELLKLISKLINIDSKWIPKAKGYSLYIRPTVIGTDESVGITPVTKALLFVLLSPVGPYYASGFKAIRLIASEKHVRAWPGGTGNYKIAGNYAPGILPQKEAVNEGYQQILWLFGSNDLITEVGTMNVFVYWINEDGENELVTPPLTHGTILPGITRDSVISLAKSMKKFKVLEKEISMPELLRASKQGRLKEMFGTGTACIISPVKEIKYRNEKITIPLDKNDPNSEAGPLAKELFETITKIQTGEVKSIWSQVIN